MMVHNHYCLDAVFGHWTKAIATFFFTSSLSNFRERFCCLSVWIELFGDDSIEQFSAQKIVCFRTFKANFHHTFHAVLWVTHNFRGKILWNFPWNLKWWNFLAEFHMLSFHINSTKRINEICVIHSGPMQHRLE